MYDDLVNSLRYEANYAYLGEEEVRLKNLIRQAADAIEELSRKEKFHAFLWNTIQPNEMAAYISMYNSGNEKEKTE